MIYVFLFLSQCYGKKGCNKYGNLCRNSNSALSAAGKTRLDRERAKMCQHEMVRHRDKWYRDTTLDYQIHEWICCFGPWMAIFFHLNQFICPIFILTFISLFSFDFYFPFSLWTFISLFPFFFIFPFSIWIFFLSRSHFGFLPNLLYFHVQNK